MNKNNIFRGYAALLVLSFFLVSHSSCKKSEDLFIPDNHHLIDSVVGEGKSVHFVYDNQQRIVEEYYQEVDSLKAHNTYHYNGNDSTPYRKDFYIGNESTPSYVGEFLYNAKHQKVYDSIYDVRNVAGYYRVNDINYDVPGRIDIVHRSGVVSGGGGFSDLKTTIYINSAGNMDSLRALYYINNGSSTLVVNHYSAVFSGYNYANIFAASSISSCNFMAGDINTSGLFMSNDFFPVLDDFNTNCFGRFVYNRENVGVFDYQSQFEFDANNRPVKQILQQTAGGGISTKSYRFVYLP